MTNELLPMLEARRVSFSYDGRRFVVLEASLSTERGEFWGLIGPNGAGKSTLLRLLTGSLRPARGEVCLEGRPLAAFARHEIARRIAFVPQKTTAAFPFSVFEMVLMGRQPYAGLAVFEDERDIALAEQALQRMGIAGLRDKTYQELSGGEQQLVVLARALAQDTPILILDEPVSFLDLRHQWEILSMLDELARRGRTVLATFHDLNAAARWCSRLALMVNGRIVEAGAPPDVLREDLLRDAYGIAVEVMRGAQDRVRVELP
jgi:iron complex transport system ATP-binding protein